MSLYNRLLMVIGLTISGLVVINYILISFVFGLKNEIGTATIAVVWTGAVVGFVLAGFIKKTVLRPITILREGTEFIRLRKDLGTRLNVTGKYELEKLGESINNMLEDLETSQKELKDRESHYKYLSFNDTLTGLFNRTYFEYEMKRISRNMDACLPVSIISVDIDGHKMVNDTLGHKAGDTQLKNAANILARSIRKGDSLARVGGDEFCIILPNVPFKVALERKEEILDLVEEHNKNNPLFPLSLSIGVAASGGEKDEDIYDIYHRADDDMYYNKFNKIGSLNGKVIEFLMEALAERDFIAQGHVERLIGLAERIAARVNLTEQQRKELVLLCKLHDLGKLGVPDEILFKPASLTGVELKKARSHVKIGYNIASRSKDLAPIADLILYHHEHWDGNGYPTGIKGEEIPLVCRVFAVLDAYDVMTNTRPYHQAKSKDEALGELKSCAGTQFDPRMVEEFVKMKKEENMENVVEIGL